MEKFGDTLRAIRKKRGLSMDALAELAGTSKQVLSRYENNERVPKISMVKKLADALNVSLAELSGDAETDSARDKFREIGQQLTESSRSDAYKSLKSELSSIKFAFLGEIQDMSDEEIQDMWDYHRFKRAQKEKQEEKQ